MKVLNPIWGSPAWIFNWESPGNLTLKASRIWFIGLPQDWGKETPHLEGTNKILCMPRPRGKGAVTLQETKPDLHASFGGWTVEVGVGRGAPQGWEHWQQQSWRVPLGVNPLGLHINPTIEPADPRAGLPQAKQLPGRESNPTHQQTIGLKLYWARPCPPEQDPVFPIANPSHQEGYTSLLASAIRGQTGDARSTVSQNILQKVNHNEKAESYVPDEGTR